MDASDTSAEEEVKRLRRCINDLISMLTLPALWSGADPPQIARTLIEVLHRLLHLELIYVQFRGVPGEDTIELARTTRSFAPEMLPGEIGAELNRLLGDDPLYWPSQTRRRWGGKDLSIVPLRLGLGHEFQMLVVGAERSDFPGQTEELLLRVAANQAVIALHEARLRSEQLRASELNLRLMAETIPEMLWSATADGVIEYCNTRLLNYTGFSLHEIKGDGWTKLIHPEDVESVARTWMSCVASGAPYRVEVRAIHAPDQTYRWCVTSAFPLLDKDGRVLKWHGTMVDMHDWKQAQETLRNTQAELANMTRVMTMGQLTASIAHEVNQPLSGIITNASTCLRMLDADPPNLDGARETVRRTIRDGNRASDVITRLRALFSKRKAVVEPVDLNEATREVIALLLSKLQRDGVNVRFELTEDLPLVAGDRVQLQQVIMNLLQNAADAVIGRHGCSQQLLVQTAREGADHVRLTVQDNGVGLDPETVERLFDPFYTTKSGGMGIGLTVSRSIIENHQGRIWAKANAGPGATFSFSIPLTSGGASDERLSKPARQIPDNESTEAARALL